MRTQSRAPTDGHAIRGTRVAFKRATTAKAGRRRVVTVRAAEDNLFSKLGTTIVKAGTSLVSAVSLGTQKVRRQVPADPNVVFVAGATGRLGAKIVKECLQAGLSVRAGVRSAEKGETLIARISDALTGKEIKRLQLAEYDLFDETSIPDAIGNAGVVVCAIGADESKPFDVSAPKKVDGNAAISLVKAAARQNVGQFVMVTSLGTTKFGWPASALNLFWGVLYYKKIAEQELQKSGMAYTIVRPGGMEKPTDSYKETHNAMLAPRDTYFGGQVSRLQVAELVATCLTSRELSENKVIEIIAEEEAPAESYETLLEEVPQEISMDELREKKAVINDAKNKARQLAEDLEGMEAELAEAEETKVIAENEFSSARAELKEVAQASKEALAASDAQKQRLSDLEEALEQAKRNDAAVKAVLDAQRKAQRSGELLSQSDIDSITYPILNPGQEEAPPPKPAGGLFGIFGRKEEEPAREEEEEEEVEEEPARIATAKGGLLGGLFGGKTTEKEPEPEPEAAVQEEEPEPSPAPSRGGFSLFGGGEKKAERPAPQAKEEAAEEEPEAEEPKEGKKQSTQRGGGLFGMFQQDTVYADDQPGAPPTAPPQDVVERAVTKRGGPGKRKSVKELVPRKGTSEEKPQEQAEAVKEAVAQAPSKKEPTKQEEAPTESQDGAPQEAVKGLFGKLFGGAPPPEEPAAKEEPTPSALSEPKEDKSPAPPTPEPVTKSADAQAEKQPVTTATAVAEKPKSEPKAETKAEPKAEPKVEHQTNEAPKEESAKESNVVPLAEAKKPVPADTTSADEARAWIEAWRARQKK